MGALWLWWQGQPRDLYTLGGWLTGGGRITGLLAGYGVAVQLLLMSRAPALDRGIGADRLARWHAFSGGYTVSLTLVHTVLITWGYAVTANEGVIPQESSFLTSYPDLMMATVALALFLLIAVLSVRAVRRRLRYETWYYLHFYTYVALGLAFAHVFADGNEFRSDESARVAWSALYIAVGLVLLTYRVVIPVSSAFRHRLRVVSVQREAPGVTSLYIAGRDLAALRAQPGQFFRWRFLTRDGWWQSHPFSLSIAPRAEVRQLRITVKALGDYTAALQQAKPGTRVIAEGPYGAITAARRGPRKVALLAGGVGITAIRALAEAFAGGAPDEVVLLYRVNAAAEIVFHAELDYLSRCGGIGVHYLIGPPGSAADVFARDRLPPVIPDIASREVFVCGPAGFIEAAGRALRQAGVPTGRVHIERFQF
jgi:predicted ferric reductase